MDQTWITADLHLSHPKVAAERGFADPAAHDKALVEMWHSLIDPSDVVWILGDITLKRWLLDGTDPMTTLADLPGRKRLVCGNHDPVHPMHKSALKPAMRQIAAEVFEWVGTTVAVTYQGVHMLLNHFPYEGDSGPLDRYQQWRLSDHGRTLVHGHTHSKVRYSETDRGERGTPQINVGMDAWGLAPVHIEDVLLSQTSYGEMP